jgi:hypothetical protein
MSDPFLDSIEKMIDSGDIPPKVANRQLLAALRIMDKKMEIQVERIGLLERWQSRANGAIAMALVLGGVGLLTTLFKLVL